MKPEQGSARHSQQKERRGRAGKIYYRNFFLFKPVFTSTQQENWISSRVVSTALPRITVVPRGMRGAGRSANEHRDFYRGGGKTPTIHNIRNLTDSA